MNVRLVLVSGLSFSYADVFWVGRLYFCEGYNLRGN